MARERDRAEGGPGVPGTSQPRATPRDCEGPTQPEARQLYQDALEALERESPEAAEDALRRSLARDDSFLATWRELALLLAEARRHDESLRAADALLARAPEDPDGLRLRAQALDALGDEEAAVAAWTRLRDCDGEVPPGFLHQATARLERLVPQAAPAETSGFAANRMPRLEPPRPEGPDGEAGVAYREAVAALEAEDPEAAEAALRRSLSRDDTAPEAWRELGLLLVDLGRLDEAPRPLREALRRAPGDLESRRALAVAADRTGEVEVAHGAYQAFLDACPETQYQRQRLHAERRLAALGRGEVDVAPEFAGGEVVELTPGWPPAQRAGFGGIAVLLVLWLLFGGEAPPEEPSRKGHQGPPAVESVFLRRADQLIPGAGAPLSGPQDLVERAGAVLALGTTDAAELVGSLLDHPNTTVVTGVVTALAEDRGPGALASLSIHVVSSHAREERASVEAAVQALLDAEDPHRVVTLVRALAVAARRHARRRASRQHIALLERALGELPEEEVAREARGYLVRATPARGQADRDVQAAMRPWIGD
jgi:tetratricopeptide (TPR) repeat protein